jgi:hypothetical protein
MKARQAFLRPCDSLRCFAILSKPSAVVFPGVIIIYEIARRKEKLFSFLKSHWIFLAVSIVLSAFFIFILMKVLNQKWLFKL